MADLIRPDWLRKKYEPLERNRVRRLLNNSNLNTVCEQACCPNMGDCFSQGTATFHILGRTCTRNCRFCAVESGRVALAVEKMALRYVVITSSSSLSHR